MIKRIEDSILSFLQRRCAHPDEMVAVDILEGDVDGLELGYCRRCGAVKPNWYRNASHSIAPLRWRLPDPDLWLG